eukprot:8082992-Pyramimonas_sp.AAC.1
MLGAARQRPLGAEMEGPQRRLRGHSRRGRRRAPGRPPRGRPCRAEAFRLPSRQSSFARDSRADRQTGEL